MKDEKYIKDRILQLEERRKEILDFYNVKDEILLDLMSETDRRQLNMFNDKISAFKEVLN